jgi:hypothetical protein
MHIGIRLIHEKRFEKIDIELGSNLDIESISPNPVLQLLSVYREQTPQLLFSLNTGSLLSGQWILKCWAADPDTDKIDYVSTIRFSVNNRIILSSDKDYLILQSQPLSNTEPGTLRLSVESNIESELTISAQTNGFTLDLSSEKGIDPSPDITIKIPSGIHEIPLYAVPVLGPYPDGNTLRGTLTINAIPSQKNLLLPTDAINPIKVSTSSSFNPSTLFLDLPTNTYKIGISLTNQIGETGETGQTGETVYGTTQILDIRDLDIAPVLLDSSKPGDLIKMVFTGTGINGETNSIQMFVSRISEGKFFPSLLFSAETIPRICNESISGELLEHIEFLEKDVTETETSATIGEFSSPQEARFQRILLEKESFLCLIGRIEPTRPVSRMKALLQNLGQVDLELCGVTDLVSSICISYDWLYPALEPKDHPYIEGEIRTILDEIYVAGTETPEAWWRKTPSNWAMSIYSSLGLGALSLPQNEKSEIWLDTAINGLRNTYLMGGADGVWPEGASYLRSGLQSSLPFHLALIQTDIPVEWPQFIGKSDEFLEACIGPDLEQIANFGDAWSGKKYVRQYSSILSILGQVYSHPKSVQLGTRILEELGPDPDTLVWEIIAQIYQIWYQTDQTDQTNRPVQLSNIYETSDWASARSGNDTGTYLAYKGGIAGQKHTHLDLGSYIFGAYGDCVVGDPSPPTYTDEYWADDLESIYWRSTKAHNVLSSDLYLQRQQAPAYSEIKDYLDNGNDFWLLTDNSMAYPEGMLTAYNREFIYIRPDILIVADKIQVGSLIQGGFPPSMASGAYRDNVQRVKIHLWLYEPTEIEITIDLCGVKDYYNHPDDLSVYINDEFYNSYDPANGSGPGNREQIIEEKIVIVRIKAENLRAGDNLVELDMSHIPDKYTWIEIDDVVVKSADDSIFFSQGADDGSPTDMTPFSSMTQEVYLSANKTRKLQYLIHTPLYVEELGGELGGAFSIKGPNSKTTLAFLPDTTALSVSNQPENPSWRTISYSLDTPDTKGTAFTAAVYKTSTSQLSSSPAAMSNANGEITISSENEIVTIKLGNTHPQTQGEAEGSMETDGLMVMRRDQGQILGYMLLGGRNAYWLDEEIIRSNTELSALTYFGQDGGHIIGTSAQSFQASFLIPHGYQINRISGNIGITMDQDPDPDPDLGSQKLTISGSGHFDIELEHSS